MDQRWKFLSLRFTLVEMLVVIAVLCILASLLLPSLQKALRSANGMTCCNNLRQFGISFAQYVDQFNGALPDPIVYPGLQGWGTCIEKVMDRSITSYGTGAGRDYGVWQCPENKVQERPMGTAGAETNCSYEPNGHGTYTAATGVAAISPLFLGTRMSKVKFPSAIYALMEGIGARCEPWYDTGAGTVPAISVGVPGIRYPHNDATNMLYGDGHLGVVGAPLAGRGAWAGTTLGFTNGKLWYYNGTGVF